MAMFDKPKSGKSSEGESMSAASTASSQSNFSTPSSKSVATIGASIQIKGDITGDENLVVEGVVEGKIELRSNDVTVGSAGKVRADVVAKVITVNGEVQGDLSGIEKVVLTKTGRIQGNISSPRVILEDGAKFKGSIDMDPVEATKPVAAPRVAPVRSADEKPVGSAVNN